MITKQRGEKLVAWSAGFSTPFLKQIIGSKKTGKYVILINSSIVLPIAEDLNEPKSENGLQRIAFRQPNCDNEAGQSKRFTVEGAPLQRRSAGTAIDSLD
jgi:hypothetical protein